jgi:hypothetical protein
MPKVLSIFRGRKSSSDFPVKKLAPTSNSIFRRSGRECDRSTSGKKQTTIVPTITFSLSEDDDEGSNTVHSPVSDIENQLQDTIKGSHHIFADTKQILPEQKETNEIAVGTEDNKTVTFTHLELMRNELAHMMKLAEKDKEIYNLRKTNEDLKLSMEETTERKNQEIAKIQELLESVEAALSETKGMLELTNKEHTKIIKVLMKTQHELYEIKLCSPSSWMTPFWNFFDMN